MNRRDWLKRGFLGITTAETALAFAGAPPAQRSGLHCGNSLIRVNVLGTESAAWSLTDPATSRTYAFAPPAFPIDGQSRPAICSALRTKQAPKRLANRVSEYRFEGKFDRDPDLSLELIFRIAPDSPVVRFCYVLHSGGAHKLTGTGEGRKLLYYRVSFEQLPQTREIQLSVFDELTHSFTPQERDIPPRDFDNRVAVMGPIVVGADGAGNCLLLAYEHGSQSPDAFLQFQTEAARALSLKSVKANYIDGQDANGYQTVWMEAAVCGGGLSAVAEHFRTFVLRSMSVDGESRKPYLFYNTWNFQERNKWWNGQKYLESMNEGRILAEIDVAHRMGIDVYVMDTGWYEKTGDWHVSRTRFPNELTGIRARLDQYGMKLGLWFDPAAAAVSSNIAAQCRRCVRQRRGKEETPEPIWETENSYRMCLVSPYGDAFADTLIRVARETGARYFKWDAIDQYGCDSPDHWHGTAANTAQERSDSHAFQLPLRLARIVEKVSAAVPDVIVDFDITEAGRSVGLSFLSAGKYFLINNGPYLFNYDLPLDKERQNWNLFFYPGPARTWICRSPLSFDKWIPSVLFLTHYLPDDPESSQTVNVASLILGQNGIWGDLLKVSDAGVKRIGDTLRRYKTVRDDITASYPVASGEPGSSPEIHEKISSRSGRGAVVIFSTTRGPFVYVTEHKPMQTVWTSSQAEVRFDAKGHAVIRANFETAGAVIVFFGSSEGA